MGRRLGFHCFGGTMNSGVNPEEDGWMLCGWIWTQLFEVLRENLPPPARLF